MIDVRPICTKRPFFLLLLADKRTRTSPPIIRPNNSLIINGYHARGAEGEVGGETPRSRGLGGSETSS